MNRLALALLALFGLSKVAFADTAYLSGELVEKTVKGNFLGFGTHHLTAFRSDTKTASRFELSHFIAPPPCPPDKLCPMYAAQALVRSFKVRKVSRDWCGQVVYDAVAAGGERLLARDSSQSRCSRNKSSWEVFLWELDSRQPRRFYGTLRPLHTVGKCEEDLFARVCPMVYLPVRCVVESLDGGRQPIDPIEIEGSNACHAEGLVRMKLCNAGYDPSRLLEGDMRCESIIENEIGSP